MAYIRNSKSKRSLAIGTALLLALPFFAAGMAAPAFSKSRPMRSSKPLSTAQQPATPQADKVESWENLDRVLKTQVYQLNVGLKIKVKGGMYAYLADMSPKFHFAVFATAPEDKGFRVVGSGSTFPIKTNRADRTFFLTNRHVVDSGEGLVKECERFFAAMRLHAHQTAGFTDPEHRYKELLNIINLSQKKDLNFAEKTLYQATADGIWDTYESYLSTKADPTRAQFQKYAALAGVEAENGYFLHPAGPVSQQAIQVQLYKVARLDTDPDLAILSSTNPQLAKLDFDAIEPAEGQEIQVIGYPLASDQIDFDSGSYYAPTFSTGRISRVAPRLLQVDAPVSVGNSGGPVISQRGKVVGVIVRRASMQQKLGGQVIQTELPNFGGAITVSSVRSFAPELFGSH